MFRTLVGRLTATALLVGAAVVAVPVSAGAHDDEPTPCQQLWDSFPVALQDDIEAALDLPLRERRRAFIDIRYDALHGDYGADVQAWAEKVRERRLEIWKKLPDQLKDDIRAAWAMPLRQQRRAMATIRDAALEGEYGEWVQTLVEKRREFLQGCPGVASRTFVASGNLAVA
jgi:hypothetical protein